MDPGPRDITEDPPAVGSAHSRGKAGALCQTASSRLRIWKPSLLLGWQGLLEFDAANELLFLHTTLEGADERFTDAVDERMLMSEGDRSG